MEALFEQTVFVVTRVVEGLCILAILAGIVLAARTLVLPHADAKARFSSVKSTLGRSILLGLELLVAADIINTVAIDPSLESLAVLAGIIAIRTFLSLSLEVEIEGRWPWRRSRPTDDQH